MNAYRLTTDAKPLEDGAELTQLVWIDLWLETDFVVKAEWLARVRPQRTTIATAVAGTSGVSLLIDCEVKCAATSYVRRKKRLMIIQDDHVHASSSSCGQVKLCHSIVYTHVGSFKEIIML